MTKTCSKCKKEKPTEEFHRRTASKDGYRSHCKECVREYRDDPEVRARQAELRTIPAFKERRNKCARERYKNDIQYREKERLRRADPKTKSQQRERQLERRYGLSKKQYLRILKEQKGKCKICGKRFDDNRCNRAEVDHCHKTKAVRGVLCSMCNKALGGFKDDVLVLQRAIDYLKKARNDV